MPQTVDNVQKSISTLEIANGGSSNRIVKERRRRSWRHLTWYF